MQIRDSCFVAVKNVLGKQIHTFVKSYWGCLADDINTWMFPFCVCFFSILGLASKWDSSIRPVHLYLLIALQRYLYLWWYSSFSYPAIYFNARWRLVWWSIALHGCFTHFSLDTWTDCVCLFNYLQLFPVADLACLYCACAINVFKSHLDRLRWTQVLDRLRAIRPAPHKSSVNMNCTKENPQQICLIYINSYWNQPQSTCIRTLGQIACNSTCATEIIRKHSQTWTVQKKIHNKCVWYINSYCKQKWT